VPTGPLRRAFSLAEVIVAAGLFAVISLILSSFLIHQLRICRRATERLGLEREQMLLHENLRQDLMATAAAGITLAPGGQGISLQPVQDVAPDGFLVYSTRRLIAYRYEADSRLHRYAWQVRPLAFSLTQVAQRLTPANWASLLSQPPDRNSYWSRLKNFHVQGELGAQDITQRMIFDTTWQDEKGPVTLRTCYFTRQNP